METAARDIPPDPDSIRRQGAGTAAGASGQRTVSWPTQVMHGGAFLQQDDALAVEEPLEIRLAIAHNGELVERSLSLTMRTPGNDRELVAGFLLSEGLIRSSAQIVEIAAAQRNVVRVELVRSVAVNWQLLERHFYTNSSCGICGKTSIHAVQLSSPHPLQPAEPTIDARLIHELPRRLHQAQELFQRTGGLHASALFDASGRLLDVREDVGRHNALDKLIGHQLLAQQLPLASHVVLVSGRASFELVQKALMAGAPILAAVGAPSSLAVQLAHKTHMTLLGFVRDSRFNIYCHPQRIAGGSP